MTLVRLWAAWLLLRLADVILRMAGRMVGPALAETIGTARLSR